jgi:hypothetical protein
MWGSGGQEGSTDLRMGYAGSGEPILGLRLYLISNPWRLGPAWAVVAGALASQAPIWVGENLLRLVGSLLLADALWGIFWRRPMFVPGVQPERRSRGVLPYVDTRGPMVHILRGLGWQDAGATEAAWQGALAGLGLVAVLSVLLGSSAIVLSLLALMASVAVRLRARRGKTPCMMLALLSMGLPWALGAGLGSGGNSFPLSRLAGGSLALGVAFTILTWTLLRAGVHGSERPVWPVWIAQIGVLAVLMVSREAVGMAVVAGCLVVPSLLTSRWPSGLSEGGAILRGSNSWWLASMLAAALAVGC